MGEVANEKETLNNKQTNKNPNWNKGERTCRGKELKPSARKHCVKLAHSVGEISQLCVLHRRWGTDLCV